MTMKLKFSALLFSLLFSFSSFSAAEWKNLNEEHHLAGRKTSAGYLRGKVVLVDRWGVKCPPCRELLPAMERVWLGFKTKPFVVLGGHCKGWGDKAGVEALVRENELTYPIYEDAGLVNEPKFDAIPFLYVVDPTGKLLYKGHDHRQATQVVVTALTDYEEPKDFRQFKRYLDYELLYLPGKASLRLAELKKRFPEEAKQYAAQERELKKVPDIRLLAEFVDFARKAKDMRVFKANQQSRQKAYEKFVRDALSSVKYKKLLESKDPRVVQEAKNCFADLKWTAAEF